VQTALKKIANILWLSLIVVIILTGILVSIGRLASPYLTDFKQDIENQVSQLTGSDVNIGKLNARWQGFGPTLVLGDIEIAPASGNLKPLKLGRIDLDLSIKSFISKGTLLPWNVVLHGIKLQLVRNADGKINIAGFTQDRDRQANENFAAEPLLQMPRIELRDTIIEWIDHTAKTPSAEFQDVSLLIKNDDDRHQLNLSFHLPGNKPQTLQLAADIEASPENLAAWSGEAFIKLRNFNATSWIKSLVPATFKLVGGFTDSDIWISHDNDAFSSISGNTSWQNIQLWNTEQQKSLPLERISTTFSLNRTRQNWKLDLENFQLQSGQITWPATRLSYHRNNQADTYLVVDHIETDLWQPIAQLILRETELVFPDMAFNGSISNLAAIWNQDLSNWYAEGQLGGFSVQVKNNEKIPAIKNLTAGFRANDKTGLLILDSQDTDYIDNKLFRNAISFTSLKGNLSWSLSAEDNLTIQSEYLRADTPHLSTTTRLKIDIPKQGKTQLDIQTDFENGDASFASLYYPAGIMGAPLLDWLDRSIISGEITSGSFVLKGPAEDFAYSKTRNGHFEVLFNTEDTVLDYFPEWPRLEEVDAQVRFHNNSLAIKLVNGKILDSEVTEATATIAALQPISPIVIKGTTYGPASDNLRILNESPLKKDFSEIASSIALSGETKVNLDFQVPLGKRGSYKLDGNVLFQNNSLRLTGWDLPLDNIQGQLNFDLDGLSSKGLKTRLLKSPVEIKVDHDENRVTHIRSKIKLSMKQFKEIFSAIPTDIIAGTALWNLDLQIPPVSLKKDKAAKLILSSQLDGVTINAPEPLRKATSETRPLRVTTTLLPGSSLPVMFEYADDIDAQLLLDTSRQDNPVLKSGYVHFGTGKKPDTRQNLFSLSGHIDLIKAEQWLELLDADMSPSEQTLPVKINLNTNKISYNDFAINNLSLNAQISSNSLYGQVNSDEFSGSFAVPNFAKFETLSLNLDKAAFTSDFQTDTDSQSETRDLESFDPSVFPDMNIQVKKLTINEHDFGNLLIKSSRGKKHMRLDEFNLDGEILDLSATGIWVNDNNQHRSSFDFHLDSSNLGNALEKLAFTPQLANGTSVFEGRVKWLGAPYDFNQETLSGELSLTLEKGRFIEFDPGVGRVLGILNIGALQRRLSLDFSDLFKEGFTFDAISADFSIDNGDAYTNNMLIKSPSATINLSGRTGLAAQDYDQLVTITPSLQSSITLAGAVAGGPAGAAVAYIAQKLVGKEVDKIARTRYTITGDWKDPQITKIKKPTANDTENNSIINTP